MTKFDDHSSVIESLKKAQEAEREVREVAREVRRFLNEPDGQWEDNVASKMLGRPRYTFDRCNDIVDDIAGEIEQADFDIRVKPSGGDATKDIAKTFDGLIRNIENLSNARDVFNASAREMVSSGFDAWRVTQRWGDNNTFDQDLYIDEIPDAIDRVWFDPDSKKQTREDAKFCFVLNSLGNDEYKEKFPKGSGMSVSTDSSVSSSSFGTGHDVVVIGEFIFKTQKKTRIVELSNGSVVIDDENYQKVKDEYAARGVSEKRSRFRMLDVIKKRFFDANGWLTDVEETVFDYLPVVPTYGNFKVVDNKIVFWGVISKKMDAQRVYNYTESRKVEEGALAPLEKIVATNEQVGAHAHAWAKLNTSKDPLIQYEHQEGQPPPYKLGGAQINPGLESVSNSALQNLQSTAGLDRLTGEPLGLRSGTAVELEQNKGDTRNYKYTASQEIAICHTAKLLVRAIPKTYDTERQVRILNEDQSFDMVMLNQEIFDEETKTKVKQNDLSVGLYDVTCDVGPAFKNRQSETIAALNELFQIDPSLLQEGKDIYLNNITTPGADQLAERARARMLLEGAIPEEQMTDEEKEKLANLPEPERDPVAIALEREADNEDDKVQLQAIEAARKDRELDHKIEQDSMKEVLEQIKVQSQVLKDAVAGIQALTAAKAQEGVTIPDGLIESQAGVVREAQAEQP